MNYVVLKVTSFTTLDITSDKRSSLMYRKCSKTFVPAIRFNVKLF